MNGKEPLQITRIEVRGMPDALPMKEYAAEPPGAMNRALDALANAEALFGCNAPPYMVLGVCGIAAAFALLVSLSFRLAIPLVLTAALLVESIAVFVGAALVRKALGSDEHVLLEDVLLVLSSGGLLTWALGGPVWQTLDCLSLALGVFLVFGRMGCLVSGCCHGRPWSIGIVYRELGPTSRPLRGIRLFPVQLAEAAWIVIVTLVSFAQLSGPAGTALWCWLISYGSGRFVLEFARGDVVRRYFGPLSEAQWIALALLAGDIAWQEAQAPVSYARIAAACGAGLLAVIGWFTRRWWLAIAPPALSARDVVVWDRFLTELEATTPEAGPRAYGGPEDTQVAFTRDHRAGGLLYAYSLSGRERPLEEQRAYALGGMIVQRLPAHRLLRVGFGAGSVFHLWTHVDEATEAAKSTSDDAPEVVRQRALAFGRALRRARVVSSDSAAAQPPSTKRRSEEAVV
jgi:hypothetical protein